MSPVSGFYQIKAFKKLKQTGFFIVICLKKDMS